MSVQRIVEDSPAIELQAEAQHTSGEIETPVCEAKPISIESMWLYQIRFFAFSQNSS